VNYRVRAKVIEVLTLVVIVGSSAGAVFMLCRLE